MSLVGWWKFNEGSGSIVYDSSGNGNDGTIISTLTWDSGITGNSLYNNVTGRVEIPDNESFHFGTTDFSIALWIKYPAGVVNPNWMLSHGTAYSAVGWSISCWQTIALIPTSIYINDGVTRLGCNVGNLAREVWHHILFTVNRTTGLMKSYLNGVYVNVTDISSVGDIGNTNVLRLLGYSGSDYRGNMDDVRLYNYVLSQKEITEIPKAKVLHYKMDNLQEPTTNIWDSIVYDRCWSSASGNACSLYTTTGNNSFTVIGTASPVGCFAVIYPYYTTTNVHHTLSCKIKNNDNVDLDVRIGIRNGDNSTDISSSTHVYIHENEVQYLTVTTTTAVSSSGVTPVIWIYSNTTDGYVNAEVTDIQFEAKNHDTPFIFGSRSGTVYDLSGYNNNASLDEATTPEWSESSKIGSGCYSFNGSSEKITVPYNVSLDFERTDSFSICLWCKRNAYGGTILANSSGGTYITPGYGIYDISGESQLRVYLSGTTNGNDLIKDFDYPSGYIYASWGFMVITYDGSISYNGLLFYYDGVVVSGDSVRNTLTETTLISNPLLINYSNFDGFIDDVRIYRRVLSPDEVKELYEVRASIDEYGQLYTQEFTEPNSHTLIDEETIYMFDNAYLSLGTFTVVDTDVSDFVESDDELGNIKLEMWVYMSSATYYPVRFEYTKLNNDQGFYLTLAASPVYEAGWSVGWNYVLMDVKPATYYSADQTPWNDMDRLEIYRSGATTGVDTSQYMIFKDVKLKKYIDNTEINFSITGSGASLALEFNEVGPTFGLVGWWKFDEDSGLIAYDSSGNGNDGTLVNTPAWVNGIIGHAIEFSGASEYVDTEVDADADNLEAISGKAWSVFVWFKTTDTGTIGIIGRGGGFGGSATYGLYLINGILYVVIKGGYTSHSSSFVYSLNDDKWHSACTTWDGTTGKLYVDGSYVKDLTIGTVALQTGYYIDIGATANGASYHFIGTIDEVRIYSRALSAIEVHQLYTIGLNDRSKLYSNNIFYTKEINELI